MNCINRVIDVYCSKCGGKLYDLSNIDDDTKSICPNCGSTYKFYRTTLKPIRNSTYVNVNTVELTDDRYSNVSIRISDKPDLTCPPKWYNLQS